MNRFFPIALFISIVFVSAQDAGPTDNDLTYQLKGTYGTLIYDGLVRRIDKGTTYEYLVGELKLEFDPDGRINSTESIDMKLIQMVATTRPAEGKKPYKVLYKDDQTVAVLLTAESPRATVKDLRFTVPKEAAEKADHLGLAATDGKLLWPMKMQTISTAKEATSQEIVGWGTATDPAGDCTFAVNDEKLMITIPGTHHDLNPGTAFGNNMMAPRVLKEAVDHFTLDVTVDPLEHPKPGTSSSSGETKHSYVGAGLLVWKDEKNFVRFERAVNGDSKNVFIQLEVFVNGEVTYSRGAACNDEPVQLRIVRKSRTFTFFRSDDGKDWKRVALVQVPLTGQMQCGVMGINATTSEFTPVFRELSITTVTEPHRDK